MKLLLLLLFVCSALAVLENSFCADAQNMLIPNDPFANVNFYLAGHNAICLTFVNRTSFVLTVKGYATKESFNVSIGPAQCQGTYMWAAAQKVVFDFPALSPAPFCTEHIIEPDYQFCSWVCGAFAGNYIPFFDNIPAPSIITIEPDTSSPPVNWGALTYPVPLYCNDTTCGSATGLVPNLNPTSANFTVRFRCQELIHLLIAAMLTVVIPLNTEWQLYQP